MVEKRELRYHNIALPDGQIVRVSQEKGADVRIALDLVACTIRKEFDVAIFFSQDQDLFEAVQEIKRIAKSQGRWITIISTFPASKKNPKTRGINSTDWFPMDKDFMMHALIRETIDKM